MPKYGPQFLVVVCFRFTERLECSEQLREKTYSRSAVRTPLCAKHVRKVLETTDYSDPMVLSPAKTLWRQCTVLRAEPRTPNLAGEPGLASCPRDSLLWPSGLLGLSLMP